MIRDDGLQIGDKIMIEFDIANKFNVSIGTVKKTLNDLVAEGILIRKRGKGTYVNHDLNVLGDYPAIFEDLCGDILGFLKMKTVKPGGKKIPSGR